MYSVMWLWLEYSEYGACCSCGRDYHKGIQYIQSFKRLCIYEPIIIIIIIEIVYVKYIKVAISVIAASGIAAATQCTCW